MLLGNLLSCGPTGSCAPAPGSASTALWKWQTAPRLTWHRWGRQGVSCGRNQAGRRHRQNASGSMHPGFEPRGRRPHQSHGPLQGGSERLATNMQQYNKQVDQYCNVWSLINNIATKKKLTGSQKSSCYVRAIPWSDGLGAALLLTIRVHIRFWFGNVTNRDHNSFLIP